MIQSGLIFHDHPYSVLIIGGSRSWETNVLLKIIKYQRQNIDKIYP